MIAPDLNAIPAYLTDLSGWMGSRTEVRGGKLRIPVIMNGQTVPS